MVNIAQALRSRLSSLFLAEKEKIPAQSTKEIGVRGDVTATFSSDKYGQEEEKVDNLKPKDYRKMLETDGQVTAIFKLVQLPILSAGYEIVDDPRWEKEEESEELQFIKHNLLDPRYKGGMEVPMDFVVEDMTNALIDGFRAYEKVYEVRDGKICLKKLAPRESDTVTVYASDNGDYNGFKQSAQFGSRSVEVDIPADKSLLVTYQKSRGWLYGQSILKPSWYHWDMKHKLYYIAHIASEVGTVRPLLVKQKTGDSAVAKAIYEAAQKLGINGVLKYGEADAELEALDVTNPAVASIVKDMIDRHDAMIAKTVLGQFLELSMPSARTGSRALAESQIEFFKMSIESIQNNFAYHINNYVIADLIRYNFNRGIYPEFRFKPLTDEKSEVFMDAFIKTIEGGSLPADILKEVVKGSADRMGLDLTNEQIDDIYTEDQKRKDEFTRSLKSPANEKKEPIVVKQSDKKIDGKNMAESETVTIRPLYPDEKKLNLLELRAAFKDGNEQAEKVLRQALGIQKKDIIAKYRRAVASNDPSILSKAKVDLAEKKKYSDLLKTILMAIYSKGKALAAEELKKPVPKNKSKDLKLITANIDSLIDKQTTDLEFRLKNVALSNMKQKNIDEDQVEYLMEQEYDSFWDSVLALTISQGTADALNMGRQATFNAYEDGIAYYRYTAVIDDRTTDYCLAMDGSVFSVLDPDFQAVSPPNHYGCRSIWTPITVNESSEYGIRAGGKPAGVPVYSSISTFRDLHEHKIEVDNKIKREQELDDARRQVLEELKAWNEK